MLFATMGEKFSYIGAKSIILFNLCPLYNLFIKIPQNPIKYFSHSSDNYDMKVKRLIYDDLKAKHFRLI